MFRFNLVHGLEFGGREARGWWSGVGIDEFEEGVYYANAGHAFSGP